MNKKDSTLLLPVVTIIIIIAGFLISLNILMPKVAEDQAKVQAADSDIERAQAKLDSINSAQSVMAKLPDIVNNLLIAVPDTIDTPDLITEVAAIAGANQVAIGTLSPPTNQSSQTGSAATASGEVTSGSTTNSSAVSVSVQGSFSNINNFISGIETSIRFSKITSLTITGSQEGNLTASISFDVYKRPAITSSAGEIK